MIDSLLKSLNNKHICVIGDLILDIFCYGNAERMSPEAPVPILDITKREERLGGALNVCHNLRSLNANVEIIGVLGNDYQAFTLEYACEKSGIKKTGLLRDPQRITTSKTRYFDVDTPLMRVDHEQRDPISVRLEEKLLLEIRRALEISDACIIQDYNKGLLTPRLIEAILSIARDFELPVFVDPKFDHINCYTGAFVIKPNRLEAEAMLGQKIPDVETAKAQAPKLRRKLGCKNLLMTMGADGMLLQTAGLGYYIPAHPLKTVDITGAGDTVIAVLCALFTIGLPLSQAAEYANLAAAKVCEQPGVTSITIDMLLAATEE
jgi:rfaE bifunctional protein kinase chain/domain